MEKYAQDQFDPNWEQAEDHGRASRIGYDPKEGLNRVCPCCLHYIDKEPIPLCQHIKQLQVFGFGIPLYFLFIKLCLMLLLISLCSYNILSIYQAVKQNYQFCHPYQSSYRMLASEVYCTSFVVQMSRIQEDLPEIQVILRIAFFFIHLFFLAYSRNILINQCHYYDERTCTLSDYALKIKDFPQQKGIKGKLQNFFNNAFKSPHKIMQYTLLPKLEKIHKLKSQIHHHIQQLRQYYKDDKTIKQSKYQIRSLQTKIQIKQTQIVNQSKYLAQLAKNDELQCQSAIILFNTDQQKQQILQQYKTIDEKKFVQYLGKGSQNLVIKQATQPNEIIWQNMNIPKKERRFRKIAGWLLSILVLAIVFLIFFFIMVEKAKLLEKTLQKDADLTQTQINGAIALVWIMLFLIILFNKLGMVFLFHIFTDWQKHKTQSSFQFSFGLKYCLGLFFTTAIMTLSVEGFYLHNYYLHAYGVIEEQTIMFLLNAVFVPFFWIINPLGLKKKLTRYLKKGRKDLTQHQADHLMEDYEYDIGKRYAQIIQTMWFTFLYATLIPVGAFLSLGGIAFYYWVDKYNYLRRSSLSHHISSQLTYLACTLLDLTLLFRVIGQIIFDVQIRDQYHASSIVFGCVAVIYLILPMNKIIDYVNHEKFLLETKKYEEVKQKFIQSYHTLHPTYMAANKQRLSMKLQKQGAQLATHKIKRVGTMGMLVTIDDHINQKNKDLEYQNIQFQTQNRLVSDVI